MIPGESRVRKVDFGDAGVKRNADGVAIGRSARILTSAPVAGAAYLTGTLSARSVIEAAAPSSADACTRDAKY